MKKLALLLLISALTQTSSALAKCDNLQQRLFSQIRFYQTAQDCSFLEEVLKPLEQVSDFFKNRLNLALFIQGRGTNASFDNGQIVWIPKKLYAYNDKQQIVYAKNTDLSAILLHEVGHAFLHERLKLEFGEEFGDLFSQLQHVSDITLKSSASGSRPSMSTRRIGQHISETSDFQKYLKHMVGYAELYADLVSVVYFNDPDIMYKSLDFATHTEFERKYIQARSFSRNHKAQKAAEATVHTEFSPVRSYLGLRMKQISSDCERVLLLEQLEDAIVEQMRQELVMTKLPELSIRNHNLIQKLKR